MTKNEYICELYEGLKELDGKIVDDVIDDVEEYFMEGKARGLSEEDIIKELGPASDFVSGLINQEKELSSSRSLTIKTDEHLYVFDNAAGKIEINGGDHFFIRSDKPYETIENDNETVYSSVRNEGFIFFNSNDMEISLDESMKNIKVISRAGDVIIRNMKPDTLHVDVSMGTLKINNVEADKLIANNKMGDVKIDGRFKEADISSGMGDTKISGSYERLNITSGCGDVKFNGNCLDNLDIKNGTGDIKLNSDNLSIEAQTGLGNVKPHECIFRNGYYVLGDGNCKTRLKNGLGDIKIWRN
ncbi:MAG: DUF4097 family beta strand repeat-containing protein [Erysipelotrichaceae bacterium]